MDTASAIRVALTSSDPESRREAMSQMLSEVVEDSLEKDELIESRLFELMLSHEVSEPERKTAAQCLGILQKEEKLFHLLSHTDSTVRGHATTAFEKCRSESSLHSLINMLKDDVNTVRNLGERALITRIEDVRQHGIEDLLILLNHPEPLTHSPAARLLGLTQDPRALAPLLTMLKDSEKWLTRVWAAKALGDLHQPEAMESLIDCLQSDQKNRVRASAANALGELKNLSATESLKKALHDGDDGVEAAARDALDLLSQSLGTDSPDPFSTE